MRRPPAWTSLALVLLGLCWLTSSVAADKLPEPIAAVLKHQGMSARGLSLYVHEIGQPEPLLAIAADAPRHPASTIKLLTTLVALEELEPGLRTGRPRPMPAPRCATGVLDGDLYIKGYGDPYLVIEHFWRFPARVARRAALTDDSAAIWCSTRAISHREPDDAGRIRSISPLRAYNVLPQRVAGEFSGGEFPLSCRNRGSSRVQIVADPLPAQSSKSRTGSR